MDILIWGAGMRGRRSIEEEWFQDCNINGFIDTYYQGKTFLNYPVYSPSQLDNLISSIDYVIILPHDCADIYKLCKEKGYNRKKLIFCEYVDDLMEEYDIPTMKKISPVCANMISMRIKKLIKTNEKDYVDSTKLIGTRGFCHEEYTDDYFRYRTFEFAANEIIDHGIMGETAELGVFQGRFSSLIHAKFSDRHLYLFDTFEGFDDREASIEKQLGRIDDSFIYAHAQGSVEKTMSKMLNTEKCHICKGLFPETITEEISRLQFAFVSIDVDLENSTYEGLRFFYPRMSEGGYIFVHDYNARNLTGVKAAVKHFEDEMNMDLKKIPLADRAGTLVIVK